MSGDPADSRDWYIRNKELDELVSATEETEAAVEQIWIAAIDEANKAVDEFEGDPSTEYWAGLGQVLAAKADESATALLIAADGLEGSRRDAERLARGLVCLRAGATTRPAPD